MRLLAEFVAHFSCGHETIKKTVNKKPSSPFAKILLLLTTRVRAQKNRLMDCWRLRGTSYCARKNLTALMIDILLLFLTCLFLSIFAILK